MFEHHFGLRENPFASGHHARFVFPSPEHQEALAHLRYGIENREPFVMITGEVGTGKTTALYDALGEWQSRVEVALITNASLKAHELLEEVTLRFGVPLAESTSKPQMLAHLERTLTAICERGDRAILLMDEAQNLEREALEEIRLLSNLERDGIKLVQVFLVGQPELEARLMRAELRQLRQRITVHYRLQPLTLEDTERYVHHRIRVAGGDPASVFPSKACRELHRLTHGIPREINTLASQALLTAFVEDAHAVAPAHVTTAAVEIEFRSVLDRVPDTSAMPESPPAAPRAPQAAATRSSPAERPAPAPPVSEGAAAEGAIDLKQIESWMTELKETRAQGAPEPASVPPPTPGRSSMARAAASAPPSPPAPRRDLAEEQRAAALSPRLRDQMEPSDDEEDFLKPSRGSHWIGVMVTVAVIAAGGVLAMRFGPWTTTPVKPNETPSPVTAMPAADSAASDTAARTDSAGAVAIGAPAPATTAPMTPVAMPASAAPKTAPTIAAGGATVAAPAASMPATDPNAPRVSFGLTVATFLDADRAQRERDKIAASTHLATSVREVKEGGSSMYRVVIGDYGSRAGAESGAGELIRRGLIEEARVVRNPRPRP